MSTTDEEIGKKKVETARLLSGLAAECYRNETFMGHWNGEDQRVFFAELHSLVTNAFESYDEEPDPRKLTWVDYETGKEVAPGKGVPQGLAVDLVAIFSRILAFSEAVGIDFGHVAADMLIAGRGHEAVEDMLADADDVDDELELLVTGGVERDEVGGGEDVTGQPSKPLSKGETAVDTVVESGTNPGDGAGGT
jgi:hypothetical protein